MTIAFFVLGRRMPSTRFRVMHYLPSLAAHGVRVRVVTTEPFCRIPALKKICRLCHYAYAWVAAWRSDLVFLQKPGFILNRWIYIRLLFRLQKKVVFDIDDAIFLNHETGLANAGRQLEKLTFILAHSCLVIAGNPYLAEFCRKYNSRVELIPTPVDCEAYYPRLIRPAGQVLTIGWMGTSSNLPYLYHLIPVINTLLAETTARFLVISGPVEKKTLPECHERIVWKTWRVGTEIDDLRLFDIGIMPLPDNAYTRGKCGFKLLQYMAVGIPVLASPVGANREIVADGVNGFLAADEREWLEKLRMLCAEETLRHRLGKAGRESVIEKYSLQKFSGPWTSLLLETAGAGE